MTSQQGEVGEIWTRGPAITPGYWNRPREEFNFDGDWFKTGDCGRLDEPGRLYVVDRLREVYRSGGENVYPAEVELVLAELPASRRSPSSAFPTHAGARSAWRSSSRWPGASVTLDALRRSTSTARSPASKSEHFATIAEMPRNATLKIDRAVLKKTYGAAPAV